MVREIQVITTGPSQDAARETADKTFDLVLGKGKWDVVQAQVLPAEQKIDEDASKAASLENGYETKVAVTVLWQGSFVARPKA